MADGSLGIRVAISNRNLKDLNKVKNKLDNSKIRHSIGRADSRNQYYISVQINEKNLLPLSKIIAFPALLTQTHYDIELTDQYKDNVESFVRWIKEEFDITPNKFEKRKNAWRVVFSNKILARYLTYFFEINPGPKAYHAHEPKIIKRSALPFRKSFAKGVLMFDGCVTKEGKMTLSIVSQRLFSSIKQIWKKDGIQFGESISERRTQYNHKKYTIYFTLFSTANNKKFKLLEYFEPHTQKWKLLHWLSGDLSYPPIIKEESFLSLTQALGIIKKLRSCDASCLKNHFNCSHTTIRIYLKILRNQKKIRLSNHPIYINNYTDNKTKLLLSDDLYKLISRRIKVEFGQDQYFAKFLGVNKSTFSAWKLKKNKLPFFILKETCKTLGIDINYALRNIIETDREIAEII